MKSILLICFYEQGSMSTLNEILYLCTTLSPYIIFFPFFFLDKETISLLLLRYFMVAPSCLTCTQWNNSQGRRLAHRILSHVVQTGKDPAHGPVPPTGQDLVVGYVSEHIQARQGTPVLQVKHLVGV